MVEAADGDLPARRAQDERSDLPARHGQHEGGAVELAVEVLPFPVAVLLRRIFEGAASGTAVLKLQGSGRGGDVRPVAPPAFGPSFLLSHFTLLGFQLASVFRTEVAPGDEAERRQENTDDASQRRGDQPVAAAPAHQLSQRTDPAGPDRLTGQEAAQVLAQVECAGVAFPRLLVQAMEANGDQVARHPGLEPARGEGLLTEQPADDVHRRGPVEGRPASQQFVQDRAQCIDVRGRADLPQPAIGLFGGHVVRCPQYLAGSRQRFGERSAWDGLEIRPTLPGAAFGRKSLEPGQAEVGNLGHAVAGEQHVGRLEVAVGDPVLVSGMDGVGQGPDQARQRRADPGVSRSAVGECRRRGTPAGGTAGRRVRRARGSGRYSGAATGPGPTPRPAAARQSGCRRWSGSF